MNRPYLSLVIIITVIAIGAVAYAAYDYAKPSNPSSVASTAPRTVGDMREYGEVSIALGETASFPDVRITPLAVLEDSRCPVNARCIQAGELRVQLETVSAMGTSTGAIELGKSLTTEAEEISFLSVSPETLAGQTIPAENYRFTFSVTKRPQEVVNPTPAPGKCYVGGCSMQICSDRPDMVSTCEYREEYACYRTAVCERQQSGECGWTPTAELTACLKGTS